MDEQNSLLMGYRVYGQIVSPPSCNDCDRCHVLWNSLPKTYIRGTLIELLGGMSYFICADRFL